MTTVLQRVGRLAGYGVGDFGLNIYWNSLTLILMFWYVQVVGLDPKVAGLIWFLGLVWDAVSDPLVASLASRNRSRYGSYRPFLLFGSFALGLSFCLLLWVPPFQGFAQITTLLIAAVIFRTCYTIVAVPYAAMSSRMTFDSDERSELSGVRMMFAFLGYLCVTSFFFPMVRLFGNGSETSAMGFWITACLSGTAATAALLICFFLTKEEEPLGGEFTNNKLWIVSLFEALFYNKALAPLLLVLFLNSASGAMWAIPLAFYLEANSGSFAHKEVVLSLLAISTLAGTPIWTLIARQIGKKKCWYVATVWHVFWSAMLAIFGPFIIAGVPLQIVAIGFSGSAFAVIIWALIPDTVEYGQYHYGVRDEAAVFGSSLFVQKASGGLAGLSVGFVLSAIGYDAQLTNQSTETAELIEYSIALVPPVLLIAASAILYIMPLTGRVHAQIVQELSKKTGK